MTTLESKFITKEPLRFFSMCGLSFIVLMTFCTAGCTGSKNPAEDSPDGGDPEDAEAGVNNNDGGGQKHPVPQENPRLFGSLEELQELSLERAVAYQRLVQVARGDNSDLHSKMISLALVSAIEEEEDLCREAIDIAMEYVEGPIRVGHEPFGHDLARCAIVYDLCRDYWTQDQRTAFYEYINETVDANVLSETHVFHNGWYGYKWWGIGLAAYATYYDNERAPGILEDLDREYISRAAPALDLAGSGGGWAEGYYIHYFLYEWLLFTEAARRCEGVDYYAQAPDFFRYRATASMFESYPGVREYGSRRPVPMGDGGGRIYGGDRDKMLSARRILVNFYSDDPIHRFVHAFNETTPVSATGVNAYKDFLWRNDTIPQGSLENMRLSHISPGPGYVYARSSWEDDATYFFFKCGNRFTAHQHLDVGHFLIYKHEELAGDGGHYDGFGSFHDVNYHMRTIAHNTMLIYDPDETWPNIRAGDVLGNDGGQHHNWPHHNGAVADVEAWNAESGLYSIADITAFEDKGDYLYVSGDATRAYSSHKLELFTRQIVFLRPGTFVIFDQVRSVQPDFEKTWLLQAMKPPVEVDGNLVITNGEGRLHIQTVLPENPVVRLFTGEELYTYGGHSYPPSRYTGAAPECRVEISPPTPARTDLFLHILTATGAEADSVERGVAQVEQDFVTLLIGDVEISFTIDDVGGSILIGDEVASFATEIEVDYL